MHNAEGLQLGVISKPHGLKGALNIIVNPFAADKIEKNNPLFIEIDGQRVPFFIQELQATVSEDHLVVKLEFINSLEEAKAFSGLKVFLDIKEQKKFANSDLNRLIGYQAIDENKNFRGTVTGFIDHNLNRILVIDFNGVEVMVPIADEVLLSIDDSGKIIKLSLPQGLIHLND